MSLEVGRDIETGPREVCNALDGARRSLGEISEGEESGEREGSEEEEEKEEEEEEEEDGSRR